MAIVNLTKGATAMVDDCFLDEVLAIGNWRIHHAQHSKVWYAKSKVRGETILMHRAIWRLAGNLDTPETIDHCNGNGLDNRLNNLRAGTRSQNQYNKGPNSRNTSGFKGVTFHKISSKWQVRIRVAGKRIFLGSFDCPTEAARAYDAAAKEMHGEFAWLNFPNP